VTPIVMWGVWRERNAMSFEGCEKSVPYLMLLFLKTLFEWNYSSGLFCNFACVA
jgi:hypothetical protein